MGNLLQRAAGNGLQAGASAPWVARFGGSWLGGLVRCRSAACFLRSLGLLALARPFWVFRAVGCWSRVFWSRVRLGWRSAASPLLSFAHTHSGLEATFEVGIGSLEEIGDRTSAVSLVGGRQSSLWGCTLKAHPISTLRPLCTGMTWRSSVFPLIRPVLFKSS